MLKQTISYTDYNGDDRQTDLYFHLGEMDMVDLIEMEPRIEAFQKSIAGEERDLRTSETIELLNILRELISKSYGIKSEDGTTFRKSQDILDNFRQSAVYDAFVMSLFENGGQNAVDFMTGILPKNIANQVSQEVQTVQLPTNVANGDSTPAWKREGREPTQKELQNMSASELREAFAAKAKAQQQN